MPRVGAVRLMILISPQFEMRIGIGEMKSFSSEPNDEPEDTPASSRPGTRDARIRDP